MKTTATRISVRRVAVLGLAVCAVATAAIVLLLGGGTYRVTASFDQVYGLIKGGRVTAGGLPIGKVERIRLGADGYPRVELQVSDAFRLHKGATASVVPPSVAGEVNRVVELTAGSGPLLSDPAQIDRSHTTTVQEFDQVLSTLDPSTRGEVRALLARFDAATVGRGPDIRRTLRHSAAALGATADVAQQLNADGVALRTLIAGAGRVVHAINRSPGALGLFADRLSGLLTTTAARQQQLNAIVAATPSALSSGQAALTRLDNSVGTLRQLARDARPGVRELRVVAPDLRRLLTAAKPALDQVDALVRTGPTYLRQITPLLKTSKPVLDSATPALSSLIPVFNQLRARLPDAFGFFSNWSAFFNNYDANGQGGRVGLVMTDPPQNLIGSSNSGPGILARPFLRDPGVLGGDPWTNYQQSFVGASP